MSAFNYQELPTFDTFSDLCDVNHYHEIGDDWWVIITDIQGSTKAIQEGRYKDVNLIGAASIMAILNVVRPVEVPYVFGGDGATICVPDSLIEQVKPALRASKRMSEQQFGLGLRLGIVPVSVVHEAGKSIRIAKFKASEHYAQAMFDGDGLQYAEALVKDPDDTQYCLSDDPNDPCDGDFSGLECRWQDITSPHGEMHAILISARSDDEKERRIIYQRVIDELNRIYPGDGSGSPVTQAHLKLSNDKKQLSGECKVRTYGKSSFGAWLYYKTLPWIVKVGKAVMNLGLGHWKQYRATLIANTDYRKFDEMLRLVLAGSTEQRLKLEAFLEEEYQDGCVFYGIHYCESALMTCIIFQYHNNHVHFIDGNNGGYAMAAKQLKGQMKDQA